MLYSVMKEIVPQVKMSNWSWRLQISRSAIQLRSRGEAASQPCPKINLPSACQGGISSAFYSRLTVEKHLK